MKIIGKYRKRPAKFHRPNMVSQCLSTRPSGYTDSLRNTRTYRNHRIEECAND